MDVPSIWEYQKSHSIWFRCFSNHPEFCTNLPLVAYRIFFGGDFLDIYIHTQNIATNHWISRPWKYKPIPVYTDNLAGLGKLATILSRLSRLLGKVGKFSILTNRNLPRITVFVLTRQGKETLGRCQDSPGCWGFMCGASRQQPCCITIRQWPFVI